MLFSYRTGYIMWHFRYQTGSGNVTLYTLSDSGNVTLYTLSDSWITYIILPFQTSWDNFRLLVRSVLLIVFCVMFLSLDCLFLFSSTGYIMWHFRLKIYIPWGSKTTFFLSLYCMNQRLPFFSLCILYQKHCLELI
jgi:hypothetical protein